MVLGDLVLGEIRFHPGRLLSPVAGVIDGFGGDVKPSAQGFYQRLGSFDLAVCWECGFAIGYDADADSLGAAVPGSARNE